MTPQSRGSMYVLMGHISHCDDEGEAAIHAAGHTTQSFAEGDPVTMLEVPIAHDLHDIAEAISSSYLPG